MTNDLIVSNIIARPPYGTTAAGRPYFFKSAVGALSFYT